MKKTAIFLASIVFMQATSQGALIISDNYDVVGSGTGFAANTGVNTDINPPTTTRLGGSAAAGLLYGESAATTKADANYLISGQQFRVNAAANAGRVFLSDGSGSFDFGSALGSDTATPGSRVQYDIRITMANSAAGTQRMSFALSTGENDANNWDFGIQLYRINTGDTTYAVGRRIDGLSWTNSALTAMDINAPMATGVGTFGAPVSFLMRVTDGGDEGTLTWNSRVQVSMDDGNSFFYDSATDPLLLHGSGDYRLRFDGEQRHIIWDIAGQAAANYDTFSVESIPEPSSIALGVLGAGALAFLRFRRSRH